MRQRQMQKQYPSREQGGMEMDWIALFDSQLPMIVLWVIGVLAFVALVYYGRTRL